MIKIELPDQQILLTWLDYDPVTGVIKFRKRERRWFTCDRSWKQWNTLYAGEIAGSSNRQLIRLQQERYSLNRIIYKMMTGKEVASVVYIDNDPTNLKWSNLKAYDDLSIMRHEHFRISKNNKSGNKCICWCKKNKSWQVQIRYHNVNYYLGEYPIYKNAEFVMLLYKDAISNGTFIDLYNSRQKKLNVNNKTGYENIQYRNGRFLVAIYINKKRKYIGIYDTIEQAVEARNKASIIKEEIEKEKVA